MNFTKAFTNELNHEAASTRKMLERVPFENPQWKPHEKSTTLINLARHVARTPSWTTMILGSDEIDFTKNPFPPYPEIKSAAELTAFHDGVVAAALSSLEKASDEEFLKMYTMRAGDKVVATLPKVAAIRNMAFNHTIHHRGQLGVYLRLLDVPIPGMYGPSADEQTFGG